MSWFHRTDKILVSGSPAKMTSTYGGSFVDGSGQAISTTDWVFNPSFPAGVPDTIPYKYLNVTPHPLDVITEMLQAEKDAVDAAEAAALVTANRGVAVAAPDDTDDDIGWRVRALIELFNKRDNYLVNRITELQEDLQAIKASTGGTANIRGAIRASYLATNTRPRSDAIQDYKDDINAGGADT